MTPQAATHIRAAVQALSDAGYLVDAGKAPAGGGWTAAPGQSTFNRYLVVHHITKGFDGTLADSHSDLDVTIQVNAVDWVLDGAARLADGAGDVILAGIQVPGRALLSVDHHHSLGVRPDLDTTPLLFMAQDQYVLATTPL